MKAGISEWADIRELPLSARYVILCVSFCAELAVFVNADLDNVAGGEVAGDYLLCNEGLDLALDKSSERTRTEVRIVAAFNNERLCFVADIQAEVLVGETSAEVVEHEVNDVENVFLGERLVEDYLVETVEKLRSELLFEQSVDLVASLLSDVALGVDAVEYAV